ncbi:MAG: hypothetical protein KDJ40_02900 [Hyphomicrobiales bacterium]|nr:hypothetical protein [Hyphomicrobiales bacterium]
MPNFGISRLGVAEKPHCRASDEFLGTQRDRSEASSILLSGSAARFHVIDKTIII